MNTFIVLKSLLSILMLAVPAFILKKLKLFDRSSIPPLSNLLLYVTNPLLSFCNIVAVEKTEELTKNMLTMFVLAFCSMLILSAIALIALKIANRNCSESAEDVAKKKTRGVLLGCFTFANVGFMGIPFVQSLYPNMQLPIIYCSIFVAVFNMFSWTIGIYFASYDRSFISVKKAFLNPATVAVILSATIYAFGFRLDLAAPTAFNALKLLGNATTPLAMSVLGIKLADVSARELFLDKRAYFGCFLRLVAAPLIIYVLLLFLPFVDQMVRTITFISLAMPCATVNVIFAEKYESDAKLAAVSFLASSVFAVITVPLLLLLL